MIFQGRHDLTFSNAILSQNVTEFEIVFEAKFEEVKERVVEIIQTSQV